MTDESAEQVIIWYRDLENRLLGHLGTVPLSKENRETYLPLLAPLVVEAGSLIDTVFREEYQNPPKDKHKLKIGDYAPNFEATLRLSNVKSLVFQYPPMLLTPFKGWTSKKSGEFAKLSWWSDYNKIKHSRTGEYKLATLNTTVTILCALQQVISTLPTFTRTLWRHNLLASQGHTHRVGQNIEDSNIRGWALVETQLFATPIGYYKFPEKIKEISPFEYGSERLAQFLGKW